jgi:ferredoxin-type protein NapH
MSYFTDSLRHLLGLPVARPTPERQGPELRVLYQEKSKERITRNYLQDTVAAHNLTRGRHRWRNRRWITLILVNLLFVVSYWFDVQLVEGAMTASRVLGFHFADLNSALQVMLAYKHLVLNLIIGTLTVLLLWWLLGGRSFCSWVCPYHLLAEWAEWIHLRLAARKWVRDVRFHRSVRALLYGVFVVLTLVSGYTIFETISPTGIVSRALIYGPGLALLWVLALLLFEIFVSRRAWCRYLCPIGITYGLVGITSPVRVRYNMEACHHEGECRKVCLVPHVLDITIKGRSPGVQVDVAADCTRCGLCVDVCPTDSLSFRVKGWDRP